MLVTAGRALRFAAVRFGRDQGFEKASSLAYSSLLAVVPAALLAVSFVELVDVERQKEVTDGVLELVFPKEATSIREGFHEYLETTRRAFTDAPPTGAVRVFSFGLLLYFALNLLQSVDRVVGAVWGSGGFRALLRRVWAYWAVITLCPLLLALSFTATALAARWVGPTIGGFLAQLLPFVVSWLAIFLFFRLMPHSPVRTHAALAGAAVTGVLWESSKLLLGWYLARPKAFLTTLSFFPAALLWMYVSWVILVYGLEVAYVVHHRSWRGGGASLGGARRGAAHDVLALAVLVEVARSFDQGHAPERTEIAEELGVAEDEAAEAVLALEAAGLLAPERGGWRPARGAAGIRAVDAVAATRGRADAGGLRGASPAAREALRFVERMQRDGDDRAAGATLAELVAATREAAPGS